MGNKEMIQIPVKEYFDLLKAKDILCALQAAGVDSWSGYGMQNEFRKSDEEIMYQIEAKML